MSYKMYEKVLLKTGEIAYIVEIFNSGEAYMADVDRINGKTETITISPDEIEKSLTIHVVAAVITHEGRIFATQRGYGEFKDMWEFPGGKIEDGETPEEALAREIKEELDTEIRVGSKITRIEYDYPAFHLSMDCFWAEVISGRLTLKEHEAARWLSKEELDSVAWLPADLKLVEMIKKAAG